MKTLGYRGLRCFRCGAVDTIRVIVQSANFHCSACEEVSTYEDVEDHLIKWGRIVDWVDKMPNSGPDFKGGGS